MWEVEMHSFSNLVSSTSWRIILWWMCPVTSNFSWSRNNVDIYKKFDGLLMALVWMSLSTMRLAIFLLIWWSVLTGWSPANSWIYYLDLGSADVPIVTYFDSSAMFLSAGTLSLNLSLIYKQTEGSWTGSAIQELKLERVWLMAQVFNIQSIDCLHECSLVNAGLFWGDNEELLRGVARLHRCLLQKLGQHLMQYQSSWLRLWILHLRLAINWSPTTNK